MRTSPTGFGAALTELICRLDEFDEGVDLADYVMVEHYPASFQYGLERGESSVFAWQFFARSVNRESVQRAAEPVFALINIATFIPDVAGKDRPLIQLQGKSGRPYQVPARNIRPIGSDLVDALNARYGRLPDFDLLVASGLPRPLAIASRETALDKLLREVGSAPARLLRERGVRYAVSLFETSLRVHEHNQTESLHDVPA